jgi:ElaA protein
MSATLRRAWSADLDPRQLYGLLRLRVDVFVVEQSCPYAELDGRDLEPGTRHFWLGSDDPSDQILGYLRLIEESDGTFRIGRVCTARPARGNGFSRRLVQAALADVGDAGCALDAQSYLAGFYTSFGFAADGAEFIMDGIPHVPMRRTARHQSA